MLTIEPRGPDLTDERTRSDCLSVPHERNDAELGAFGLDESDRAGRLFDRQPVVVVSAHDLCARPGIARERLRELGDDRVQCDVGRPRSRHRSLRTSRSSPRSLIQTLHPGGLTQSDECTQLKHTVCAGRHERREGFGPDEDRSPLCPRHRDVDPVSAEQEAHPARHVAVRGRRHGNDRDRRLLPLELVDGPDSHGLKASRGERVTNECDLSVVRSDDQEVAGNQRPRRRGVVRVIPDGARGSRAPARRPPRPPRVTRFGCPSASTLTTWRPAVTPSSDRAAAAGGSVEPTLVGQHRDALAQVRMHAVRLGRGSSPDPRGWSGAPP